MKSKPNYKLSLKDYLFLAICLLIFFLAGLYLHGGTMPTNNTLILVSLGGIIVAILIVLYVLKKLNDELK